MKKPFLLIWSLLRLPILGAAIFLFRAQAASFLEHTVQLNVIADFVVYTLSTFPTRLYIVFGLVLALCIAHWVIGKAVASETVKHILFVLAAFTAGWVFFQFLVLTSNSIFRTIAVTALAAINNLPGEWLAKRVSMSKGVDVFFTTAIGIAEAFFPQSYLLWLRGHFNQTSHPKPDNSWATGVVTASFFAVFLLTPFNNQRILTLGELLHADPAVTKFAEGEYNWIELNPKNNELYAVGYYSNFIMIFNTDEIKAPPRKSKTSIDGTQSFGFNPDLQQVYVYNHMARELVYLDAPDLSLTRTLPITDLSNGDVWVKWNRLTDTITLASEADLNTGTPFYLLDRKSGEVRATMSMPTIPTAFIVFHPDKPLLYFNSFKDTYLAVWDMEKHQIIRQTETSPRTDRMIFSPGTSEIMVASPMEGLILRYDAEKLELTGKIKTSLGDRTIALDPIRNLLIVGNFFNNEIKVIDLDTEKTLKEYYLGPWIRTIALDTKNGVAYVSTVRNLFKVTYAVP